MLVTAEARDMRHCPPCLTQAILEAIGDEDDTPDPPPVREPYDSPLLPWERELLGLNDDDDYPIGQVRG